MVQARTCYILKLLLIYGSVSFSSSLRLPCSVHRNLPWAISLPCLLHAAVCCEDGGSYIVPGATLLGSTNLVYSQQVVTACYRKTLLHKPLPFYGFVFVLLSYSGSLAGFHLESTSNSLGAPLYGRRACRRHLNTYIYIIIYIYNY